MWIIRLSIFINFQARSGWGSEKISECTWRGTNQPREKPYKIGYIIFLYQTENSTNFGSGENFPAAMKMSASRQIIWSYEGL